MVHCSLPATYTYHQLSSRGACLHVFRNAAAGIQLDSVSLMVSERKMKGVAWCITLGMTQAWYRSCCKCWFCLSSVLESAKHRARHEAAAICCGLVLVLATIVMSKPGYQNLAAQVALMVYQNVIGVPVETDCLLLIRSQPHACTGIDA